MESIDTVRTVVQKHLRRLPTVSVRTTPRRPASCPINNAARRDTVTPFRLLDLPVELRVMIYEYTFGDDGPRDIDIFHIHDHYPTYNLLWTSRQIYKEAHQAYQHANKQLFEDKTFYISITKACTNQDHMQSLCRRLSRHRFKDHHNVSLRFTALKACEANEYVQLNLSLAPPNSHLLLIAEVRNGDFMSNMTPIQIFTIANAYVRIRRESLRWM